MWTLIPMFCQCRRGPVCKSAGLPAAKFLKPRVNKHKPTLWSCAKQNDTSYCPDTGCQSSYTLTYIITTCSSKTKPWILFWWGVLHAWNPSLSWWLWHAIVTQNYGNHISSLCPVNCTLVVFLLQALSDWHSTESRVHRRVVAGCSHLNVVNVDPNVWIGGYVSICI